jgi:hypothetical protein
MYVSLNRMQASLEFRATYKLSFSSGNAIVIDIIVMTDFIDGICLWLQRPDVRWREMTGTSDHCSQSYVTGSRATTAPPVARWWLKVRRWPTEKWITRKIRAPCQSRNFQTLLYHQIINHLYHYSPAIIGSVLGCIFSLVLLQTPPPNKAGQSNLIHSPALAMCAHS